MRIAISAGHGLSSRTPGAIDSGAVGSGYKESTVVLGMAKRLAADFAAIGWPCLVRDSGYYSKADDEAKNFGAAVFMELHLNAGTPSAHGVEVLVGANPSAAEARLASLTARGIAAAGGLTNRGVKVRKDLAVLRQWAHDSILVELAFVSNGNDMKRYQANVDAIELAIVNAVLRTYYFKPVPSLPRKWSTLRAGWAKLITYR